MNYRYWLFDLLGAADAGPITDPDSVMRSPLTLRSRASAFEHAQRLANERGGVVIVFRHGEGMACAENIGSASPEGAA